MKAFYQNAETLKWEIIDNLDNLLQLAPGCYKLKTNSDKTHVWIFEGKHSIVNALVTDIIKNPTTGAKYSDFDDLDIATKDFFADATLQIEGRVASVEESTSLIDERVTTLEENPGGRPTYSIWGYVDTHSLLPLGTTETDPRIGDLVGVNYDSGISVFGIGNKRYKGFYKRLDITGVIATDYGIVPFAAFPVQADQPTVDLGEDDTMFVTPLTLKNSSKLRGLVYTTDERLTDARQASDVYAWAKEPTKPTYTANEVNAVPNNGASKVLLTSIDNSIPVPANIYESFVFPHNFGQETTICIIDSNGHYRPLKNSASVFFDEDNFMIKGTPSTTTDPWQMTTATNMLSPFTSPPLIPGAWGELQLRTSNPSAAPASVSIRKHSGNISNDAFEIPYSPNIGVRLEVNITINNPFNETGGYIFVGLAESVGGSSFPATATIFKNYVGLLHNGDSPTNWHFICRNASGATSLINNTSIPVTNETTFVIERLKGNADVWYLKFNNEIIMTLSSNTPNLRMQRAFNFTRTSGMLDTALSCDYISLLLYK